MMPGPERVLPEGFIWKQIPEFDLYVPMPRTWFYNPKVSKHNATIDIAEHAPKPTGEMDTGLRIVITKNHTESKGFNVENLAKGSLNPSQLLIPVGHLKTDEDGPIIISRRLFRTPEIHREAPIGKSGMILEARYIPGHISYYLAGGNRDTDTGYFACFTAVHDDFNNVRRGATMIDNMILSKTT